MFVDETYHIGFVHVHKRADYGKLGSVQIRHRGEGVDAPFKDKGHEHGLHHIVLMMGICHLLAAQFFDGLVQGAFPHLCAEGTGIFLLALLEDDLCDIGLDDGVRHFQFPAQILNLIQVEVPEAQIYCDRMDVEPFRIEAPQALERIEKREAVFAAGDTHGNPVPVRYHLIIVHSLTDIAQYLLKLHVHTFLSVTILVFLCNKDKC